MSTLKVTDTAPEAAETKLSRREIEVLTLIVQGGSSQEVADMLFVSKRTIDFHLESIYRKLQIKNRVQAYCWAIRLGLVSHG